MKPRENDPIPKRKHKSIEPSTQGRVWVYWLSKDWWTMDGNPNWRRLSWHTDGSGVRWCLMERVAEHA